MNNVRMVVLAVAGAVVLSGCATKGALRRGLEEQQAQLEAERQARLAGDEQLASSIEGVDRNMLALRDDLDGMNRDFDVRVAALERGLQFAMPVHFAFDAAEVREDDRAALDRFVEVAQRHYPGSLITVEGFADPAGSAAYNKRLSQRRAEAVRDYLVSRGLGGSQVRAVGLGETRQVVPGAAGSAAGAEMNRRVVFMIEGAGTDVAALPGQPAPGGIR